MASELMGTNRFLENILLYMEGYFVVQNPGAGRMAAGIIQGIRILGESQSPSIAVFLCGVSHAIGYPDSSRVEWARAADEIMPFYVIPLNDYGIVIDDCGRAVLASNANPDMLIFHRKNGKSFDPAEVWGLEKKL